jgi:hypothetical protein
MYIPNGDLNFQRNHIQLRQPVLYNWFLELENLQQIGGTYSNGIESWDLFGRGFLVEGKDNDAYESFLDWISCSLNIPCIKICKTQIADLKKVIDELTELSLIYLESGDWLDGYELSEEDKNPRSVITEVFQKNATKPILITSICENYNDVAEEFRYLGRFDRHISWSSPRPEIYAEDFILMIGANYLSQEILNNKKRLGALLSSDFSSLRRLEMLCITAQRRYRSTHQKLTFKDFIEIAIQGTGSGVYGHPHTNLEQIAVHEAGHAVISMVESNFKNIPDYLSILPGKDMLGIMVDDYQYGYESQAQMTFGKMRSKIRTYLAGRAAEELIFGCDGVNIFSAVEDLQEASREALHLMSKGGFHASYGSEQENLTDGLFIELSNRSSENFDYYQTNARKLLQIQYRIVKEILYKNKHLLVMLKSKLLESKFLIQAEIKEILHQMSQQKLSRVLYSSIPVGINHTFKIS